MKKDKEFFLRQQEQQWDFLVSRSLHFVGREAELRKLEDHIRSQENRPFVVTGEPGQGKSAFLAQFAKNCAATFPDTKVIFYFAGATSESISLYSMLEYLCLGLDDSVAMESADNLSKLIETFAVVLKRMGERQKVVLVLDALNQLRDLPGLSWIPLPLPSGVHLVFSTLEGPLTEIARNEKFDELILPRLSHEEALTVIRNGLQDQASRLQEDDFHKFLGKKSATLPLYLHVALTELRRLKTRQIGDRIEILPDDLVSMFSDMFVSLEAQYDKECGFPFVSLAFSLLGASRGGLYENELVALLRSQSLRQANASQQFDAAEMWEKLASGVADYLLPRGKGKASRVAFFHEQMVQACHKTYLQKSYKQIHKLLADYFSEKEDARFLSEYTYHLSEDGEKDKLYQILCSAWFIESQVREFGNYARSYESLIHGIQAYLDGTAPDETSRLSRLLLKAGQISDQAKKNIDQAFVWMKEGKMPEAMQRLDVLDDRNFCQAVVLALWIETRRQMALPAEQRSNIYVQHVIHAMETRASRSGKASYTGDCYFSTSFMSSWAYFLQETVSNADLLKLLQMSESKHEILYDLSCRLASQGKLDKAYEWISKTAPRHQIEFVGMMLKSGLKEYARKLLDIALQSADKISELWARCGIWKDMIANPFIRQEKEICTAILDRVLKYIPDADGNFEPILSTILELSEVCDIAAIRPTLSQIIEKLRRLPDGGNLAQSKAESMSKLALVYEKLGSGDESDSMMNQALKIARNIEKAYYRDNALKSVALELAQIGRFEEAREIYIEAERYPDAHSGIYVAIMQKQIDDGQIPKALEMIGLIKNDYYIRQIVTHLAKKHELAQAINVAERIGSFHARLYTIHGLAEILEKRGDFSQARQLFQDELALCPKEPKENDQQCAALGYLADFEMRQGKLEEALQLIENNVPSHLRLFFQIADASIAASKSELISKVLAILPKAGFTDYSCVAEILDRAGFFEKACQTLWKTITVKPKESLNEKDAAMLMTIEIQIQCLQGDWQNVQETWKDVQKSKKATIYPALIVETMLECNEFSMASQVIPWIRGEWNICRAYKSLATQMASVPDLKTVLPLTIRMPDYAKELFVRAIADRLDKEPALAGSGLLPLVGKTAEEIWFYWHKTIAIAEIAKVFEKYGEKKMSIQMLTQARASAEKIEYARHRVVALSYIARSLAQIGKKQEAEDLFTQSLNDLEKIASHTSLVEFYKVTCLARIARNLFMTDYTDWSVRIYSQAIDFLQKMPVDSGKSKAFKRFVETLYELAASEKLQDVFSRLLQIVRQNQDPQECYRETGEIVGALVSCGKIAYAWEQVESIPLQYRDCALSEVLQNLQYVNDPEEKRRYLPKLLAEAKNAKSVTAYTYANIGNLAGIANMYIMMEEFDNAMEILRSNVEIKDFRRTAECLANSPYSERHAGWFYELLQYTVTRSANHDVLETLLHLFKAMALNRLTDLVPKFLAETRLTQPMFYQLLFQWQKALVSHHPHPVEAIKTTLTIFPFDYVAAYHATQMLRLAYLKEKNIGQTKAVERVLSEEGKT